MKTILRDPYEVSTNTSSIRKATNYKNQMKFTGIKQDDNIYAIDQDSSRDAQNVYVDDNQRLSSRPPLQKVDLPTNILLSKSNNQNVTGSITPATYRLIDIKDFGSGKIYISSSTLSTTPTYYIVAVLNETPTLNNNTTLVVDSVTNYHIALIEHYVICFNNVNAKILDTNNLSKGWQNFTDYAEVPVVKRITGSSVSKFDINNIIPNKYIEEYIWTNESKPILPQREVCDITLVSNKGEFKFKDKTIWADYVDYQLNAPTNIPQNVTSGISAAKNIVCIWKSTYFMVSYDYGNSFTNVSCPTMDSRIHGQALSKDAKYYFIVAEDGVYRCELSSLTWSLPFKRRDNNGRFGPFPTYTSMNGTFLTGDIFAFTISNHSFYSIYKDSILAAGSTLLYDCVIKAGSIINGVTYATDTTTNYIDITQSSTIKAGSLLSTNSIAASGSNVNGISYSETTTFDPNNYGTETLYFKGPGLYNGSDYSNDHMDSSQPDYYQLDYIETVSIPTIKSFVDIGHPASGPNISLVTNRNGIQVAMITMGRSSTVWAESPADNAKTSVVYILGGDNSHLWTTSTTMLTGYLDLTNRTVNYQTVYKPRGLDIYSQDLQSSDISAPTNNLILVKSIVYNERTGHELANAKDMTISITLTVGATPTTTLAYSNIKTIRNLWTTGAGWNLPKKFGELYISNYGYQVYTVNGTTSTRIKRGVHITDGSSNSLNEPAYSIIDFTQTSLLAITDEVYYARGQVNDNTGVWSNYLQDTDSFRLDYTIGSIDNYTDVPTISYTDTEMYLGFDNLLQITYNTKDPEEPTKTLFNLLAINNQSFIDNITAMINISTTEVALFFENKIVICSKVEDSNLSQGFRYDYYNTKLSTGVRLGDSVINTLEGSYTIFPTLRGLAAMNYQAFMATTDQVVAYLSDVIKEIWTDFYMKSKEIHIIQWRSRLVITNDTEYCLIFDIEEKAWWKWKVPVKFNKAMSDQIFLQMIENSGTTDDTLRVFDPEAKVYFDYSGDKNREDWKMIEWYIMSQPLHFNQPNYYKNIKQLVFQLQSDAERQLADGSYTKEGVKHSIDAQVRLYRKKITTREPETINFTIDGLRTFVKRFNYWKINELKWVLSYDENTASPQRFELNGVSVKYEIGDEVR